MKPWSCFPWVDSSSKPRCHEVHGCNNDEASPSALQYIGGEKKVNLVGRTGGSNLVMSLSF
jgi:hypothetical protein